MVRKLPALAALVASLGAPANVHALNIPPQKQQVRIQNYSISDIAGLLDKRGKPLYFAAKGEIVRIRYAPISQTILIDIIKEPTAGEELRELSTEDPLRAKLNGNFTSDLYIISSGRQFGDDTRDEYSPLNKPIQQGFKIGLEGKTQLDNYLQKIGSLLK